ncbi:MAG: methyltransferase domain-containing protein [Candidatus Thorarchaeota archaeon]
MSERESEDKYKHIYFVDPQEVTLEKIGGSGYLLDIGGGGEGVIGQLEGLRVVAIDNRKDELEEASVGEYLRVVMDATDLQFLDSTFSTATAFFSMMYMNMGTKRKVFDEVHRVLAPGGEFLLWDMNIPEQSVESKSVYAIMLKIHLPDRVIETGYGCPWADRQQDLSDFKKLGTELGFEVFEESVSEYMFQLRFKKSA